MNHTALIASLLAFFALLAPLSAEVAGTPFGKIDEPSRFIFYSVLEGLYEDGLSTEDVNQILRKEGGYFVHFVYGCPICTPAIWGLEAYRDRPPRLYALKSGQSTFGPGLPPKLRDQLYSEDANHRLAAVNALVQSWIDRRMDLLRLSKSERARLTAELEEKRKIGMDALHRTRVSDMSPGYRNMPECAVCNGAVGKSLPPPTPKK